MKARLLTAAVGIPLAVLLLVLFEYFNWVAYIILSAFCAFMTYEVLTAKSLHKNLFIAIPSIAFAILEPFLISTKYAVIPIFLYGIIVFFAMIAKSEAIKLNDVTFALSVTYLIVLGMSSILLLAEYISGFSLAFVLSLGIAWISDAGAFFAGVFLGKHKLCPKVSPNKTVEGFVGGLLAGTLSAILIGLIYSSYSPYNYLLLAVMGLFGSLVSVLGDLTFSQIKRACGIKDYGSLMPGHGGVLDRFDSVIFISPLMYLFTLYLV